jgi:hypothetical protein
MAIGNLSKKIRLILLKSFWKIKFGLCWVIWQFRVISLKKLCEIWTGSPSHPSLVVYCPSEIWTLEMEHNLSLANKSGAKFIWARFLSSPLTQITHVDRPKIRIRDNLIVVNFPWSYKEHLTKYRSISALRKLIINELDLLDWRNLWILGLDNDEVVEDLLFSKISGELKNLNSITAYTFDRLWVVKLDGLWRKNNLAKTSGMENDVQCRLYKLTTAFGTNDYHNNTFFFKKRKFVTEYPIYHSAYKEDQLSRLNKVLNLDEINLGVGSTKRRYYLPESFDLEFEEKWTTLQMRMQNFLEYIYNVNRKSLDEEDLSQL